ncbi:response regulator [Synechocystis sp. LKSZ1]|uniref:response regulator n=1 Tax=Synechocystis sp. LKSZ1 TaxID=3144951 RepID=UPI00336C1999
MSVMSPLPSTSAIQTIQEIPYQLLRQLVADKVTGKLTIQNPFDEFVNWQIYLGNGKIHFANSAAGSIERLNYLLGSHLHQRKITLPPQLTDDYRYLCDLWKQEIFSFQQTRSILTQFTQEALVQILSLPKTTCYLDPKGGLEQLFLNLNLEQVIAPVQHKIRYWWELRSEVNSPFQRPLVEDWNRVQTTLAKAHHQSNGWLKKLHHALESLQCLYGIASQTQLSTLQLAMLLRPLIKTGEITMLPYQEIQTDNRPLVVCINDRPAIQRMVQYTLVANGFKTMALEDPFKALAILLSQQPSLVFMDAQMQDMSGYELCSLCRKTPSLKDLPIIMLTDNDNLIERLRAKLAGASGFLQKPFLPQELLQSIQGQLPARISLEG